MNSSNYCLDTHPLVWYFTGQKTLSQQAKQVLDDIFTGKATAFIPTIVLLEAFHVSMKKKEFLFPLFLQRLRLSTISIVPLDKVVLSACFRLPKRLSIHDRIIAATALVSKGILITKDPQIKSITKIKTLW